MARIKVHTVEAGIHIFTDQTCVQKHKGISDQKEPKRGF